MWCHTLSRHSDVAHSTRLRANPSTRAHISHDKSLSPTTPPHVTQPQVTIPITALCPYHPTQPTLASLHLSSASPARTSASAALSVAAFSSSSCFFWYSGARLRDSRSCRVGGDGGRCRLR